MSKKKYTVLNLFCGAGGLSRGLIWLLSRSVSLYQAYGRFTLSVRAIPEPQRYLQ